MVRKILRLSLSVILVVCFFACNDRDDFSSDPHLRLSFSPDTIRFDTLFSTIGSTTRELRIYNNNNSSLTISSVQLMNPSVSGFRMNLDGQRGTMFSDVDILKRDSLFAFIEITVNPSHSGSPLIVRDSIRFVTNGNIQYVQLEAVGQDVHIWKGKTIAVDTLLTNDKPYLIYDSLVVKEGATLGIDKGVRFFFRRNAAMQVYGVLNAKGTVSERIIFRGDRFDNIEANIPYDNVSGQWGGIFFHPQSFGNRLENVFVRNSTKGLTFLQSEPRLKKASLINTIVHNTSEYGVLAINSNISGENCLFTNSRGATLRLIGGKYSFIHSTIANYYRWSTRQSSTFVIGNAQSADKTFPLEQCDITNSIIYGSFSNELSQESVSAASFVYRFTNCIIRASVQSSSQFVNIIWNTDPRFRDLNSQGNYFYNFELQSDSPAINQADKSAAAVVPFDLLGRSRLNDSNPDIGCYEWISDK